MVVGCSTFSLRSGRRRACEPVGGTIVMSEPLQVRKTVFYLFRVLAMIPVVFGIVWLIAQHHHGGSKGDAIPVLDVATCVAISFVAAYSCKRFWFVTAVPFVAGIFGSFACGVSGGLFGGVLGVLIGCLALLLPFGPRRRLSLTSPTTHKAVTFGCAESRKQS